MYRFFSPLLVALCLGATQAYPHANKRQNGPVAPGTAEDCTWYDDAVDSSYDCEYFEWQWGLTHEQFVLWNPSVGEDCSGIVVGNSYCVEVNNGQPTPTSTAVEPTLTASPTPSPTQPGLIDTCTTFHLAVKGDTCDSIVSKYNTFTQEDFIAWNPAVGEDCIIWAEYYYCVGVPGTPTEPPTTTATVTPGPSPTQTGIIDTCTRYHQAVSGDNCADVVAQYGITMDQFLEWNQAVSADCAGFWLDYYYCVGIPGTSEPPESTTTTTEAPAGPTPTQTGIIESCQNYHKAVSGDNCAEVVAEYGITLDQFLEWNKAVSADCSGFWLGYYYCIGILGTPTDTPDTTPTSEPPPTGPSPTQTGIIDSCTRYHKAVDGDSCAVIVDQYGTFTLEEFLAWNTAVGADCSGLWLNYYYCIGIPGTPTTPPTDPTPTGCRNPNLPTPTQPGAVCNCNKWHKVASGDTCATIHEEYGVSAASFNRWNPQVGADCKTLWRAYYVCVGV